jgi:hypothetical protein
MPQDRGEQVNTPEPPPDWNLDPLCEHLPLCTSGPVDDDKRVRLTVVYALGLLGDARQATRAAKALVHLSDSKGILIVGYRGRLSSAARRALERAWLDVAGETMVVFVLFRSRNWGEWTGLW